MDRSQRRLLLSRSLQPSVGRVNEALHLPPKQYRTLRRPATTRRHSIRTATHPTPTQIRRTPTELTGTPTLLTQTDAPRAHVQRVHIRVVTSPISRDSPSLTFTWFDGPL